MSLDYSTNVLKSKMENGKVVFGTFVKIYSPAIMEILGYAGFDFAIIDMEHGPMGYSQAEDMVRAASLSSITPIVRVASNKDYEIQKALDIGAGGVQVPQVNDRLSAEYASNSAYYYPQGNRGVCKYVRAAKYSAISNENYFIKANQETLVVVHIEGKRGVRELPKILAVEGLDVIFLGPYDLSQSLGVTGQVDHPDVVTTMENAIDKIVKAGKIAGTFCSSVDDVLRWVTRGVHYVAFGTDTGFLYNSAKELIIHLENLVIT